MKTHLLALRVLACLLIVCAACGFSCRRKAADEPQTEKPEANLPTVEPQTDKPDANVIEPNTATKSAGEGIAATVNGVDITEAEIEELIKPVLDAMAARGQQLAPQFIEQYKRNLRQQALEKIIIEKLLDAKVKQANVEVTEEEVTEQLEEIAAAQEPPLSLAQFKEKVESYGQSFDQVRQQVRKQVTYQKVMEPEWAGKINITEEDTKKYYDENERRYSTPEQVRASHILITPEEFADPNTDPNQAKEKALAKAKDLLKQVREEADFAELAKANSKDPVSAARGGDLNFFARGRMVAPFEKAAFEMEVGQISDIVETQFGYHIIKVTDRKEAAVTPFEQVKDKLVKELTQRKQAEFARAYIESVKASADIVYPPGKEPKPSMPPSMPAPGR
jgi:peptidyl-prolyl cis-trans isomerase C